MDTMEKIEQLRKQLELAISSQNQKLCSESIVVLSKKLDELILKEIKQRIKNK